MILAVANKHNKEDESKYFKVTYKVSFKYRPLVELKKQLQLIPPTENVESNFLFILNVVYEEDYRSSPDKDKRNVQVAVLTANLIQK